LTTAVEKGKVKETLPRVYLVKADGSGARPLGRKGQGAYGGRFSPDGRRVLYLGFEGDREKPVQGLYVVDAAGGEPRKVSQELNADFMGHGWSPDGRRIAYTWRQVPADGNLERETESFLMVVGADGKDPQTVLSEKADHGLIISLTGPDWR
jgi:Tol biopolymer transport system component